MSIFRKITTPCFLIMIFSLLTLQVAAQDQRSDAILEKTKAKYSNYSDLRIHFTQTIKNPETQMEYSSEGELFLKGDMFRFKIEDQVMISDNVNIWFYFENNGKVDEVIIDYVSTSDMFKPSDIFSLYEKDFMYRHTGTQRIGGRNLDVIQFVPKSSRHKEEAFFHSINLYVSPTDGAIHRATIRDKNNTEITYTINNLYPNNNLSKSFFSFDRAKHPQAIVTDKRRN